MSPTTQALLAAGILLVVAGLIGLRGPWPVAELKCDEGAVCCPVCVRAVAELERGGT